ncbi:MAG: NAD-dependent deacylase [Thermodesulfobacteriota bacterium]|nr:NAD-dependent deacylase [Thermodesulfobacteriota bacterium]
MFESAMEDAARILIGSRSALAFTGAGISAESGIPTFRDPGGIWDRFDPAEIGTASGIKQFAARYPERLREFLKESAASFGNAQPNPSHYGLAELEKMGILKSVVTQNVDDFHSIAGNTKVFEVHGNLYRFKCMACGSTQKHSRDDILSGVTSALDAEPFTVDGLLSALPKCECSGFMRPDVVMFGEEVQDLSVSFLEAQNADVVIVLGTSGVVWPAAGVPYEGKKHGAGVIEINPSENAFRDISDVYIKGLSGEIMPRLVELVRALR